MSKLVNYFKFIISQLGQLQSSSWKLWFFSLGVQLMIFLGTGAPITPISILTFIGTNLGVLCVTAINSAKPINGWLGILSAICFILISFTAKNYLAIFEQVAYVITLDIPVLVSTNWNKNLASKIRHFGPKEWLISLVFTAVVWAAGSGLISYFTNEPRPVVDGMSFAICLTAGIVCSLRYNNQYFWWLASGLAQIVLWYVTFKQGGASMGMLINSCIYVINDILAFTVSPWFNAKARNNMIENDAKLDAEV